VVPEANMRAGGRGVKGSRRTGAARDPRVRRCPRPDGENAKTPRDAKTQGGGTEARGSRALRKECHPEGPPSCHPEEQSDEGSASTKALAPLGQIPPLPLADARGRVRDDRWGWALTLGGAFGMTGGDGRKRSGARSG